MRSERNTPITMVARSRLQNRPSWIALFTRAYALVAREMPELRRYYQKFPWPHLYEFPYSIASVAIENAAAQATTLALDSRTGDAADRS